MISKTKLLQIFLEKFNEFQLAHSILSDPDNNCTSSEFDRVQSNYNILYDELLLLADILEDDLPEQYQLTIDFIRPVFSASLSDIEMILSDC